MSTYRKKVTDREIEKSGDWDRMRFGDSCIRRILLNSHLYTLPSHFFKDLRIDIEKDLKRDNS